MASINWPADLAYYVREYGVGIPPDFLKHMEASGGSAPQLSYEELVALTEAVLGPD